MDRLVYFWVDKGAGLMKSLLLEMLKQLVVMAWTLSTHQAFADLCWTTLDKGLSGILIQDNLRRALKWLGEESKLRTSTVNDKKAKVS